MAEPSGRRMKRIIFASTILAISALACATGSPRKLELYPSPTVLPTQTPFVLEITTTPLPTDFVIITTTPVPTENTVFLCVSANEAVYLRASPGTEFHPITPLSNGTKVIDTKTRSGNWAFVQLGEDAGWINTKYLERCN